MCRYTCRPVYIHGVFGVNAHTLHDYHFTSNDKDIEFQIQRICQSLVAPNSDLLDLAWWSVDKHLKMKVL